MQLKGQNIREQPYSLVHGFCQYLHLGAARNFKFDSSPACTPGNNKAHSDKHADIPGPLVECSVERRIQNKGSQSW